MFLDDFTYYMQRLILSFLLLFNQCLYNPIVKEVLDLEKDAKRNKSLNSFLLNATLGLPLFGSDISATSTEPTASDSQTPTAEITPSLGNIILGNTSIKVVFSKSMDPNSLSATLGTNLTASWSKTSLSDDTVTLSASIPLGSNSFILNAKDVNGKDLTEIKGTYIVLSSNTNVLYVSPLGSDSNSGSSPALPKLTIPAAISSATTPAAIFISSGDYNMNSNLSFIVNLVDKVSLYGGFSQDFSSRNISTYTSKISDVATSVIGSTVTVYSDATITSATIVDGLTIVGSSNTNASVNSYAIFCNVGNPTISNNTIQAGSVSSQGAIAILINGASPTISGNTISGGISTGNSSFGIFIQNISAPSIINNQISGGSAPAGAAHAIYNGPQANTPTISGNTIYGGSGAISYGLNTSHPSDFNLSNNTIDGGIGTNSYAIYHGNGGSGNVGSYQNNTLFTSGGTNRYCLYEAGAISSPISFNNNHIFDCPSAYYFDQGTTTIFSFVTINGGTTNGSSYTGNY